jgi:streptolysin S family bacteriocin protoxin
MLFDGLQGVDRSTPPCARCWRFQLSPLAPHHSPVTKASMPRGLRVCCCACACCSAAGVGDGMAELLGGRRARFAAGCFQREVPWPLRVLPALGCCGLGCMARAGLQPRCGFRVGARVQPDHVRKPTAGHPCCCWWHGDCGALSWRAAGRVAAVLCGWVWGVFDRS